MKSCLKLLYLLPFLAFACTSVNDKKRSNTVVKSEQFDRNKAVTVFAASQADFRVELELQEIDAYYTAFRIRTTNAVEACEDSLLGILHLADTVTGNAEIREDDFKNAIFAEGLTNDEANCGFGLERDIEGGYRVWLNVYDCPAVPLGCSFAAGNQVIYKQGERIGDQFVSGFVPASRTRLLTEADLAAFPDWSLIRNEIFARYGHPFNTERYQWIFGERTDWYQALDTSVTAEDLNSFERKNVAFLQNLEAKGYTGFRSYLAALTVALSENDQPKIRQRIAPHLLEELEYVFPEESITAYQNNEYRIRWNLESKQMELIIGDEEGGQLQYYFDKIFDAKAKGRWILTQMLAAG